LPGNAGGKGVGDIVLVVDHWNKSGSKIGEMNEKTKKGAFL
jgi:hypothetical protein